jgi:hypothetical protein
MENAIIMISNEPNFIMPMVDCYKLFPNYMKISIFIVCLFLSACSSDTIRSSKNKVAQYYPTYTRDLEDTSWTLDLTYISWSCQCANWAMEDDFQKSQDMGENLSDKSIFIEPADSTLELPDTLGYSGDLIRFIGRFYRERGYPKRYPKTEMQVQKAKVFKYTKYEVLNSGYREFVGDKTSNK